MEHHPRTDLTSSYHQLLGVRVLTCEFEGDTSVQTLSKTLLSVTVTWLVSSVYSLPGIDTHPLYLSAFSPSSFPPVSLSLSAGLLLLGHAACSPGFVVVQSLSFTCCCIIFVCGFGFSGGKLRRSRLLENPEASCLAY